jgi:putative SOS response-associated peptidase YedK
MCGRYRLSRPKYLVEYFDAEPLEEDFRASYNVAPTQAIATVRSGHAKRVLSHMRWGLIPSWAGDIAIGNRMINARSETLLEKAAFRDSFRQRRCLIPADGFYEWKRSGKTKRPFLFGMKDDSLFVFAGIWDCWKTPAGKLLESCSILTTTPNDLVKDIHDRMPVILPNANYEPWLTVGPDKAERLLEMLVPLDASLMRMHEVSPLVNSPNNNSPECAAEVTGETRLGQLELGLG